MDGHLFFDPAWSPDGRSVVYLDCHPDDARQHSCLTSLLGFLACLTERWVAAQTRVT